MLVGLSLTNQPFWNFGYPHLWKAPNERTSLDGKIGDSVDDIGFPRVLLGNPRGNF